MGVGRVPCVPILVTDLLLHLGICQGLQQWAPLVSIACVPNGNLHRGQGVLTGLGTRKKSASSERQLERTQKPLSTPCPPADGRLEPGHGGKAQTFPASSSNPSLLSPSAPQSHTPDRSSRGCHCHLSLKAKVPRDTRTSPGHIIAHLTPGFSSKQEVLCCCLSISGSERLNRGICCEEGSLNRTLRLGSCFHWGWREGRAACPAQGPEPGPTD